jgi:hypothetical protein
MKIIEGNENISARTYAQNHKLAWHYPSLAGASAHEENVGNGHGAERCGRTGHEPYFLPPKTAAVVETSKISDRK